MVYCKSLRHKLDSARQLTADDWRIVAQAWWWLLLTDLLLRLLPLQHAQSKTAPFTGHLPESAESISARLHRLYRLVSVAARYHLYPMTCLRQSLVLQRLLARRGIAVLLKIGVRKEAGILAAHAWLEYRGQPIGQPEAIAQHYAPLLPSKGRQ
ncbi:MAG: lasso peptide biosynthesis B2 protein [Candidatus Contendobacter sp.]